MRKLTMLGSGVLALSLLAGCGGGGSSSEDKVTRVLVGYVYVTRNSGGSYTGPATAFILPVNNLNVIDPTPANPDSGDEIPIAKPTAGTVTLSVDGSLTRAVDTETFNLATSNEIICTAKGKENGLVSVAASGIALDSVAKTFQSFSVSLGTKAADGTNLGLQSANTPTYTPGNPDDIRLRLRTTKGVGGVAANGDWKSPDDMMASNGTGLGAGFVAGQVYDVAAAVLDANGIVVTGSSVTVTPSDLTRVTYASNQLTPALGQTTADVQVTVAVTGYALVSKTFHGDYNQGTATTLTVTPAGPTDLLWAAAGAEATQTLTVTAKNELGVNIAGATVNMTSNKSTSNDWDTGSFDSTTAVFTPASGTTDANGQFATVVTAPTSTGALAAGNPAKGLCTVTATVGSKTGTATLNITRPLGAITITGPSGLDTGAMTPDPSIAPTPANIVKVSAAADIDGDAVAEPSVTWAGVNTPDGGNLVGNTGDTSLRSVSNAAINATTGRVTAGTIAGQFVVTATSGTVTSNQLTIEIYGKPSKLVYDPNTNATGGYTGAAGAVRNFDVMFVDSFGHDLTGEVTSLTTQSGISSSAAGQISNGGVNVKNFNLTFGTGTGTFTISVTQGTWTGTHKPDPTTGVMGNSSPVDFSGLFRSGSVN